MLPTWHLHEDVLLFAVVLFGGYEYAARKLGRPTRRQRGAWYAGAGLMVVFSYWPIHELAEQSLFSVHMVQHMTYTLFAPPLLLMGLTRAMADRTLARPLLLPAMKRLAHPFVAFALFNLTMVITHWPNLVNLTLRSEIFHFSVHSWLVITAILAWLPVVSPTPALPALRPPMRVLYLFFQSILPTVPASFLTFATHPLYSGYGNAALAFGWTPVADQTMAGVIMKLGGTFFMWVVIALIWFRWASAEDRWEKIEQELRQA